MARGRPSKKQHIVDTAMRLFTEMGYQSTSIDQVVQAAAVSKPTVYANFPSKQDLWLDVLRQILSLAEEDLATIQRQDVDAHVFWLQSWQQWVSSAERITAYRIMLGEQHKLTDQAKAGFRQLEQRFSDHLSHLYQALDLSEQNRFLLQACGNEWWLWPILNQSSKALPTEDQVKALFKALSVTSSPIRL